MNAPFRVSYRGSKTRHLQTFLNLPSTLTNMYGNHN